MVEAIGRDAIREALQEMFRDSFRPSRQAIGNIAARLSTGTVEIVHLGYHTHPDDPAVSSCGAEIDNSDHMSMEHNEITCPLCYAIHEATCAKGDGESSYYEWDLDSILETDEFMDNCVSEIIVRLDQKAAEARFIRSVLAGNAIDGKQFD